VIHSDGSKVWYKDGERYYLGKRMFRDTD
jgi:hypothetical protein